MSGNLGYHRPDVTAAFPQAPGKNCGFQIDIAPPRGRFTLRLEAQSPDGIWHAFFATTADGKWWRRPYLLGADSPAELLAGQLALQPQHPPRPLQPESFPSLGDRSNLPELDLVTPSFNQSTFLPATLASVRTSSPAGVRHHVRDGASTDGSVAVLEQHGADLHHWVSEPDEGQADAIAKGFAQTSGRPDDLMAWLNADDVLLPGSLDFVRGYFASHPNVDVIYGNRVLIDRDGQEVGRWHLPPHDPEVLQLYDFVPQETLFWRRRIWDTVGGIDRSLQFAIDWDLLLRFQAAGARMVHLPRFLGGFRLHSTQKSASLIGTTGQAELDHLRRRTFGRDLSPDELIQSPVLNRYLRRSARRTLAARFGFRPSI